MSDLKKLNNLKIGFIADGVKKFTKSDIFHDSSFALMLAAQKLNTNILLTESNNLKIINNKVFAKFDEVNVKQEENNHIFINNSIELPLQELDIIFARKDPPVNEDFISYALMLTLISEADKSKKKPLIINDPFSLLKANEKLYALNFPTLIPTTLVTSKKNEIIDFVNEYKEAVVKPLFDKGGGGIFYIDKESKSTYTIIEAVTKDETHTVLVQKYIPDVVNGDKRIILLNGNPIGAILRVPKAGEFRANMNKGASVKACNLSKRDLEICEAIKPFLQRDGLYFTGIDVIGNYLTEINVTSPTGLQEIQKLNGTSPADEIIQWAMDSI